MTILREEDIEIALKVIIVGDGAVGKSSMIQRYCKGYFTAEYKKTIGVDFLEKMIGSPSGDVRLMLWDTAGQEEFDAITRAYYRGAQACVIAFSTTDRNSFLSVKKWRKKVQDECGNIPTVLVQNKIDLIDEATVKSDEAELLAKNLHLRLYRASVKEDLNVDQVFNFLVDKHVTLISQPEDIFMAGGITHDIFGNPDKLKKGDTITLSIKKKATKRQLIKNACKLI